jgi:hypothetical protein
MVVSIALESSDQKTFIFLVLVVFLWWFLKYVRKLFSEMCERQ